MPRPCEGGMRPRVNARTIAAGTPARGGEPERRARAADSISRRDRSACGKAGAAVESRLGMDARQAGGASGNKQRLSGEVGERRESRTASSSPRAEPDGASKRRLVLSPRAADGHVFPERVSDIDRLDGGRGQAAGAVCRRVAVRKEEGASGLLARVPRRRSG